jgi:hypothetical protein
VGFSKKIKSWNWSILSELFFSNEEIFENNKIFVKVTCKIKYRFKLKEEGRYNGIIKLSNEYNSIMINQEINR